MLPCCASSVCEICAKERIAGTKCPMQDCESTEADPGDLIPNRRLRAKTQIYREKNNVPLRERTPPPITTDEDEAQDSLKTLLSILPNSNRSPEPEEIEAVQNQLLSEPVPSREPTIHFETNHGSSPKDEPEKKDGIPNNGLETEPKGEALNGTFEAMNGEGAQSTEEAVAAQPSEEKAAGSDHQLKEEEEELRGDAIPTITHGVEIPRELMKEAVHDPLAAFNKLMQVRDKEKGIVNAEQHYGQAPPQYDKDAIYNATYAHKGYYHNSHMYGGQPKRCFTCNKVGHLDKHCRFNPQSINYMPSSHMMGRNHREDSEYYRSLNEASFRRSQSRERSRRSRSRRISGSGDEKRTRRSRSPFGKSGKKRSKSRSRSRSAARTTRKRSRSSSRSKSVARKRYRSRSRSKPRKSRSRSPSRRKSRSSSRSRKSPKRSEKKKKKRERSSSRETKRDKKKKEKKDRRSSRDETPPKKKKKASREKSPESKPRKDVSKEESHKQNNNSEKSDEDVKQKRASSYDRDRNTSPDKDLSSRIKMKKSPERASYTKDHRESSSSRDGPGLHFRERKSTIGDIQKETRRSQSPQESSSKETVANAENSDEPFFTPTKFSNSKIEIKLNSPKIKVIDSKPELKEQALEPRLESNDAHQNDRKSSPSASKVASRKYRYSQSSSPSPPRKMKSDSKSSETEKRKKTQLDDKSNHSKKPSDKPSNDKKKSPDVPTRGDYSQQDRKIHSPKRRSRSRTPKARSRSRTPKRKSRSRTPKRISTPRTIKRRSRSRTPKRKSRSISPKGRTKFRSPDRSNRKYDQLRDEPRSISHINPGRELSPIEEKHFSERKVQLMSGSKIGDSMAVKVKKKKKKAKTKRKKNRKVVSSDSEEEASSSSSSSSSSSESSDNSSYSDSSDEKNSASKKLKRKKKHKSKKSKKKAKKRAKAKKNKSMDVILEQGAKVAKIRLSESDLQNPEYLQQILVQQLKKASEVEKSGSKKENVQRTDNQEIQREVKTQDEVLELGKSSSIELKINIVNSSCDTAKPQVADKTAPHIAQVQGTEEDEEANSEHEESGSTMAYVRESQLSGDNKSPL